MSNEPTIDWDEVIKKEARGKNDEDLGEEVGDTYVVVQKGLISKEKFLRRKVASIYCDND
jgi:hypothetical protein